MNLLDLTKQSRRNQHRTKTLGELIGVLAAVEDKSIPVIFDFCRMRPTNVRSSRGSYDELAIGHADCDDNVTVSDLLLDLTDAVGATFEGYKGGEFVMDLGTPVWADNWGKWTGTAITGVQTTTARAVLMTKATGE